MSRSNPLHQWLDESARRWPHRVAVEELPEQSISYRELAALSDRVRDRLCCLGVRPGDRVGIVLTKSIDAVAAIFGALKAGAAYVPCDPTAPPTRNAYILADCAVKAVVVEQRLLVGLRPELAQLGAQPAILETVGTGGGAPLAATLVAAEQADAAPAIASATPGPDELAYILYTSGSTGRPKGVMLTHRNGASYVDWCSETFAPTEQDRFSSHAPLHFDLSILDLYVPLKHGATLVLVSHEVGKEPARLAPLIAERKLTVWYSAPSILSLLVQFGDLPRHDYSALRLVLFAGEVFPVAHLRALQSLIPHPRYFNLYGPTETNVCTFHEIPPNIPAERTDPYPIGKTCSHLESRVVDGDQRKVARGQEGELCIRGPAVTQGYWNLPDQTSAAFLADEQGCAWYRTGDIVVEDAASDYIFRGRRDRMVKKRGYRVELGEIEACLYRHPQIRQAAVIALESDDGVRIKAFVCTQDGTRLSLIALKSFCSQHLPLYMIPDVFSFQPTLPTTSTDKLDYQRLKQIE